MNALPCERWLPLVWQQSTEGELPRARQRLARRPELLLRVRDAASPYAGEGCLHLAAAGRHEAGVGARSTLVVAPHPRGSAGSR